jgi:fucose permease
MTSSVTSALLPSIKTEIALSYFQSSFILTGNFIGMLIAVLFSTFFADRVPKKAILFSGSLFMVAGLFMAFASVGYPILLTALILTGIGFGFYEVGVNALGADLAALEDSSKAGSSMNFLHFFYGIGSMLAPVLVWLCVRLGAWRAAFAVIAFLPILVATLALAVSYPKPAQQIKEKAKSSPIPKADKPRGGLFIACICVSAIFYVGSEVTAFGWLPLYWRNLRGAPSFISPEITATFFWAALTFGRVIFKSLPDRLGFGRFLTLSAVAGLACAILWFFFPLPWLSLVLATLLGFGISSVYPGLMAYATSSFPERTGLISSVVSICAAVAGFLIPIAFGLLADKLGIQILPAILCVTIAALAVCNLLAWRQDGRVSRR